MAEYLPRHQHQGPASNCVIGGKNLGWLSCSAYGMAVGIDEATRGSKRPSGCDVRYHTGDTVGGLSLPQVAAVAEREYGVDVEVRVGSNACSPEYAARKLYDGHCFGLQGNTGALLGTAFQSTAGPVNHYVHVSARRGGTIYRPDAALVYDPAADGRGSYAQGPQWWDWPTVLRFAARLEPWADGRILGPGRMYAGFLPDTEPHVTYRYGGRATAPQPVRFLARAPEGRLVNVRSGPTTSHPIVFRLRPGGEGSTGRFYAFQLTTRGQRLTGRVGEKWYGNVDGTAWVHETGLRKP